MRRERRRRRRRARRAGGHRFGPIRHFLTGRRARARGRGRPLRRPRRWAPFFPFPIGYCGGVSSIAVRSVYRGRTPTKGASSPAPSSTGKNTYSCSLRVAPSPIRGTGATKKATFSQRCSSLSSSVAHIISLYDPRNLGMPISLTM